VNEEGVNEGILWYVSIEATCLARRHLGAVTPVQNTGGALMKRELGMPWVKKKS